MSTLGGFHRHVWQRLPRGLRRAALFRGAALLAPRPTPTPDPEGPVIVAGVLRASSGLGQAARLSLEALAEAGVPVYGLDLTAALRQPADATVVPFRDARDLAGPGTVLMHVNGPLMPLAMLAAGRKVVAGKQIVGCWAWELPDLPDDWLPGFGFVHRIVAPSAFSAAAIGRHAGALPVSVLPHPVAVRQHLTASRRRHDGPFTVLTVFDMASSVARKNPLGAVRAFRLAFADHPAARLILKSARREVAPGAASELAAAIAGASNIAWHDGVLSDVEVAGFFDQADACLSLHRAEGFGLTLAEAMLRGVDTIATGWSGNLEFQSSETARLVPCTFVPAVDPQATYHHPTMTWADPDVDAAAGALVAAKAERSDTEGRRQATAANLADRLSAARYAEAVRRLVIG